MTITSTDVVGQNCHRLTSASTAATASTPALKHLFQRFSLVDELNGDLFGYVG